MCFFIQTASADDINIKQYPESPREGEEVKLTLTSSKYDLNLANITWTLDEIEQDSGIGRKTLTFKTSQNGKSQTVGIVVKQDGYEDSYLQYIVEANTSFILYEGVDSYVPNFYKGRRLPTKEGVTRVGFFSFKNGDIVGFGNSSDLYTWKVNGESRNDLSGTNKIVGQIIGKVTDGSFGINISKQDSEGVVKTSETTIPLTGTETIIYKTDEKKLTKKPIIQVETGKNINLLVEPFFFSAKTKRDPDLNYEWKINDIKNSISTPWSVVFTGKDKESVKINLNILNNKKITQESSSGFTFKVE